MSIKYKSYLRYKIVMENVLLVELIHVGKMGLLVGLEPVRVELMYQRLEHTAMPSLHSIWHL